MADDNDLVSIGDDGRPATKDLLETAAAGVDCAQLGAYDGDPHGRTL
jgi:hypothetical protein